MSARPLVSVLTPSYNQGRWLGDNLRSVARQSYQHTEQIVMDGGSTDGTLDVLGDAPGHVRWRSEPDRGQSHALNKALAESRGEIICWLNSDDAYFSTDAIASAVAFLDTHPTVDVVYGHAALVNADGLILQMIWAPPFNAWLFGIHTFIIQPTAFIRRSALGDVIADETYDSAMDRELWLRLGRQHRFARLDHVLAIDRHHPARKSNSQPAIARADNKRLATTYPVPNGWWTPAARKAFSIIFRLLGLRLLSRAGGPYAFQAVRDGPARLALRQVAMKRAAMPAGDAMTARPEHAPS